MVTPTHASRNARVDWVLLSIQEAARRTRGDVHRQSEDGLRQDAWRCFALRATGAYTLLWIKPRWRKSHALSDPCHSVALWCSHLFPGPDQTSWTCSWVPSGRATRLVRIWSPKRLTDSFFPERGGKGNAGRALCRRCPVAEQCLELALTEGEAFGIWGGTSERERRYEGGPSVGIDRVEFLEARARFRRSSKC